jgi:hypothetical protein
LISHFRQHTALWQQSTVQIRAQTDRVPQLPRFERARGQSIEHPFEAAQLSFENPRARTRLNLSTSDLADQQLFEK